jgi:DNA-binding response OmpR family regulator
MKKRIIVVEDDADILFTVKIVVETHGYEVSALTSGKTIVEEDYECPHLFILDKRMPDMDGIDLCKRIKATRKSRDIPVIMMSATPKFGPQALDAGATDFLETIRYQ